MIIQIFKDTKGLIQGSVRFHKSLFSPRILSGHVDVLLRKENSILMPATEYSEDIAGCVFLDKHLKPRGRVFIRYLGPVWGTPTITSINQNSVSVTVKNLRLLTPYFSYLFIVYSLLPLGFRKSLLGEIAKVIGNQIIEIRSKISIRKLNVYAILRMEGSNMSSIEQGEAFPPNDSWVKIKKGMYIDRTPKKERFREISRTAVQAVEALENRENGACAK